MSLTRRNFLRNAFGLLVAAPMVVKAETLMKPRGLIVPTNSLVEGETYVIHNGVAKTITLKRGVWQRISLSGNGQTLSMYVKGNKTDQEFHLSLEGDHFKAGGTPDKIIDIEVGGMALHQDVLRPTSYVRQHAINSSEFSAQRSGYPGGGTFRVQSREPYVVAKAQDSWRSILGLG